MEWFWHHYLTDPGEAAIPYAAPLKAGDLAGLPPAFVMTAEYDPLRNEGERYAERLQAAGVPTLLSRPDEMNHGFLFWVGAIDRAGPAMADACDRLRRAFGHAR